MIDFSTYVNNALTVMAEEVTESTSVSSASADSVSAGSVSVSTVSQAAAESVAQISEDIGEFQAFLQALPSKITAFGIKAAFAIIIFIGGIWLIKVIRHILKKSMEKGKADKSISHFVDSLVKVVLYAVLVIWIASYFGVETTSLVALLGSAGVTVALAIQGSLSNLTGGILILLLKPFKLGDYIHEDNKGNEGTVNEIGLFYTKLYTIDGRTVVLPNGTLANTSLINVNMTPIRQLILSFGISYSADIDKAKDIIHETVDAESRILSDKTVKIYVDSLDSSCVTIGLRAFVNNEDYFDVKWALTENVKKAFDKNGIEIPFDQIDVHMKEG